MTRDELRERVLALWPTTSHIGITIALRRQGFACNMPAVERIIIQARERGDPRAVCKRGPKNGARSHV